MLAFRDRTDAGQRLAAVLAGYRDRDAVVLALPRGGVPVAAEIADALHAPLDLILVRKIGVPFQPELAMGAVVDGAEPIVVRNDEVIDAAGVSEAAFRAVCDAELAEIERRRVRYLGARDRSPIAGHVVIVVDDGVATGATMRAALQATRRRHPGELILAVPVGSPDTIEALRREVDALVCLEAPWAFGSIGEFYADFTQVDDGTVIDLLRARPASVPSGAAHGGAA